VYGRRAVADALASWVWDALDLEGLPILLRVRCRALGRRDGPVEEDAPGGGPTVRRFGGLERIPGPERRCGHGLQVVVERRHDRSDSDLTYLRKVSMWRIAVSCGRQGDIRA